MNSAVTAIMHQGLRLIFSTYNLHLIIITRLGLLVGTE